MEANRVVVAVVLGIIVVASVAGIGYLMTGNVDSDVEQQSDNFSSQLDCIFSNDETAKCTEGRPEKDAFTRIQPV
ncbi:MAG: hypothetical protein ABEJ91_02325 [Candidatus Nanohaloarchaea archaeon]